MTRGKDTDRTFRVGDGHVVFEAAPGETVLGAARRAGLTIPDTCGGKGECLVCRFDLIEGELSPLSAKERVSADQLFGSRLSCQARPRSDVLVEFPTPVRWLRDPASE